MCIFAFRKFDFRFKGGGGLVVEFVAKGSNPVPCFLFSNYITHTTMFEWILHMDETDWSKEKN